MNAVQEARELRERTSRSIAEQRKVAARIISEMAELVALTREVIRQTREITKPK